MYLLKEQQALERKRLEIEQQFKELHLRAQLSKSKALEQTYAGAMDEATSSEEHVNHSTPNAASTTTRQLSADAQTAVGYFAV